MLAYILTTPFEVRRTYKYLGCLEEKRGKFQMLCSGASEQLRQGAVLPVWTFIKPENPEKIIKCLVDFSWCSFWSSVSCPLADRRLLVLLTHLLTKCITSYFMEGKKSINSCHEVLVFQHSFQFFYKNGTKKLGYSIL